MLLLFIVNLNNNVNMYYLNIYFYSLYLIIFSSFHKILLISVESKLFKAIKVLFINDSMTVSCGLNELLFTN